jgi:hypothetical protein
LDYIIPKGISQTSVQNPTYEFQKRNISPIQENINSIQNYQELSFLPVTLTGMALCSLNSELDMDSFVGLLCISFEGLVAIYLLVMLGVLKSIVLCFLLLFMMTSLGA